MSYFASPPFLMFHLKSRPLESGEPFACRHSERPTDAFHSAGCSAARLYALPSAGGFTLSCPFTRTTPRSQNVESGTSSSSTNMTLSNFNTPIRRKIPRTSSSTMACRITMKSMWTLGISQSTELQEISLPTVWEIPTSVSRRPFARNPLPHDFQLSLRVFMSSSQREMEPALSSD